LAGFRITRVISVFSVFPVDGFETLAWLMLKARVFVLPPRVRWVFFAVSLCMVSIGNDPFSYLRFVL
jgi:hypothetical protein